jgi:hypothetical protein
MSKHRKPPGDKSSSGKKQKTERKRELKEKTIAAEIGGVVMREEAAKPEPRPAAEVAKPAPRPVAEAAKPVPRPTPPREETAKAVRRPVPEAAKPAPRPVRPVVSQAPASKKPLEPRSVPAKPLAAVEPEASPEPKAAESAAESWQRSFDAARLGTVEVNRLLLDIGRRNIASGFELGRSLATARTPMEAVQLQLAFFDERMRTLLHQAEALRALSVDLVARANEPIREQLRMKRMTAWWG